MGLIADLKKIYWLDICRKTGRFQYVNSMFRNIPGQLGQILRARITTKYFKSVGKEIVLHPGIRFVGAHNLEVGDNVWIGVDNFIQASAGLQIGNHTLLGPGVKIWTINHVFQCTDTPIADQGYDMKPVIIGDNVWIGANAFIMPGVQIPEGCIVSAGSVVGVKKYKPYSIIAGNPARVIGSRAPAEKKASVEKKDETSPTTEGSSQGESEGKKDTAPTEQSETNLNNPSPVSATDTDSANTATEADTAK